MIFVIGGLVAFASASIVEQIFLCFFRSVPVAVLMPLSAVVYLLLRSLSLTAFGINSAVASAVVSVLVLAVMPLVVTP